MPARCVIILNLQPSRPNKFSPLTSALRAKNLPSKTCAIIAPFITRGNGVKKTIQGVDIEQAISLARETLKDDKKLSPASRATFELLLLLVTLLWNSISVNSRNSSLPPSQDPNRDKTPQAKGKRKPGGQPGHNGVTLAPVDEPDTVRELRCDRRTLPKGKRYRKVGVEKRQVFDIEFRRLVTEYQAEVLEDEQGKRYVAPFPDGVSRPAQYGQALKAHAVYLSQYQLLPYDRIREYFHDQLGIPLSAGSLFNFNQEAYNKAQGFEQWVKQKLTNAALAQADETGINIDGKRRWLHCVSNDQLTLLHAHTARGGAATREMGVLPHFQGVLCHDHWKAYYQYDCTHALCNAHHLRELQKAHEQEGQQWPLRMQELLTRARQETEDAGGQLLPKRVRYWRRRYRACLGEADKECPPPDESQRNGKRGRLKRSPARNLLERLRDYENDVLRFMEVRFVPFTNNLAENDLRMTKVQQKISGCFRSLEGAQIFCRLRSYLSTARKQGMRGSDALTMLLDGKTPPFMMDENNSSSDQ